MSVDQLPELIMARHQQILRDVYKSEFILHLAQEAANNMTEDVSCH